MDAETECVRAQPENQIVLLFRSANLHFRPESMSPLAWRLGQKENPWCGCQILMGCQRLMGCVVCQWQKECMLVLEGDWSCVTAAGAESRFLESRQFLHRCCQQ
jgi:hypothetical protein